MIANILHAPEKAFFPQSGFDVFDGNDGDDDAIINVAIKALGVFSMLLGAISVAAALPLLFKASLGGCVLVLGISMFVLGHDIFKLGSNFEDYDRKLAHTLTAEGRALWGYLTGGAKGAAEARLNHFTQGMILKPLYMLIGQAFIPNK